MKPLILVVEDNNDVLYNITLSLELNNFKVVSCNNGKQALQILDQLETPPNIIISDIMMPVMDGYSFFKKVSENIEWNDIPFIFLTAKSLPEDIRLGKMLGVDDYLIKPFKEEDLIAVIKGKLARMKKRKELVESLCLNNVSLIRDDYKKFTILLLVIWDDKLGPTLKTCYPRNENFEFVNSISLQLYQSASSIYGQKGIIQAQSLLLNIHNIKKSGFIYFDSKEDASTRSGRLDYMLCVLAPKINYFESLKIKQILKMASKNFKERNLIELEKFWNQILEILMNPQN